MLYGPLQAPEHPAEATRSDFRSNQKLRLQLGPWIVGLVQHISGLWGLPRRQWGALHCPAHGFHDPLRIRPWPIWWHPIVWAVLAQTECVWCSFSASSCLWVAMQTTAGIPPSGRQWMTSLFQGTFHSFPSDFVATASWWVLPNISMSPEFPYITSITMSIVSQTNAQQMVLSPFCVCHMHWLLSNKFLFPRAYIKPAANSCWIILRHGNTKAVKRHKG